jgi:uncharacterized membrane protein YidH (DUF202 family)
MTTDRPTQVFDPGLQHERTALAWERTAIASMVAGVLFARYAAESLHPAAAVFGVAQVVIGGLVLVWAAQHYDDLHGPLRAGESPAHPTAARIVGFTSVLFTGAALIVAVIITIGR